MAVVLAFNERTKSYFLFRESSVNGFSLVIKTSEDESAKVLSASVNKCPQNLKYTLKPIAKFDTALGFLKHKKKIYLIVADKSRVVSEIKGEQILQISSTKAFELGDVPPLTCSIDPELRKLVSYFSSGVFFYSENSDISFNRQIKGNNEKGIIDERTETFIWNQHLLSPITDLASQIPIEQTNFLLGSEIFSKITKGFFKKVKKTISSNVYDIAVHTRIGKKKAGTRFNSRGLDGEGNVSIFGETEVIIASDNFTFSYIILRGSVPVFWDQQGLQIGPASIQITRAPLATQPSFDRHFENIIDNYGLIHVANLLSGRDGSAELLLTDAFEYHTNNSIHSEKISFTSFDLNKVLQNNDKSGIENLFQHISRDVVLFGFHVNFNETGVQRQQKGIFRVNCLDCLDRTNLGQDFIARKVVDLFFRNYLLGQNFKQIDSIRIQSAISRLFADNGDAISLIYSGTEALKTAYTRTGRLGILDFVDDFKKSAYRMYCGNVTDKSKQATLDYILGINSEDSKVEFFNPISKHVQHQLKLRKSQYISYKKIKISAITWNTGGFVASDFDNYFVDFAKILTERTDIYIVCLQEIVQLNATQIVSSDPEKRQLWEVVFLEMLGEYHGSNKFVTLVSSQLVGTSLMVFVNSDWVDEIKNVELSSIKTGLGGIAGNKGSVAVRFEISGNSFCFIGSHFPAGQSAAVERLKEYTYISRELSFSKGKRILPNDFVFWLGDFNFRNDCDGIWAKERIKTGDLTSLLKTDQLSTLKSSSRLFENFLEMDINFAPTYKYDPGTNVYDTSEKNRVPSWTDRILFSCIRFVGQSYGRIEVDVSDHKPVFLSGSLELERCNHSILQKLEQEIYSKFSIEDSDVPELPPRPVK